MNWIVKTKGNDDLTDLLTEYTPIIAQLLFNRGIKNITQAHKFLNNNFTNMIPSQMMPGVKDATQVILDAVKQNKKIIVYGDYDVDGIVSTSILFDLLYRRLGADVVPYIPNRFDEGYSLNAKALDSILEQKGELIITVDCGIKDRDLVKEYTDKGLEFIITDHHMIQLDGKDIKDIIPSDAKAIVHPQLELDYPFKEICGAMVVWKLIDCVLDVAKENKILINEIDKMHYVDLVALATVCDIMPLIEENRIIVDHGIKQIQKSNNLGIRELAKVLNIEIKEISAYHFGYVFGPRLNASGRLESALEAVRLLTSNDQQKVQETAQFLDKLNTQRQELTFKLIEEAENLAKEQLDNKLLFLLGEDWPEGIVGLVAGKIAEKYHRPVLVATKTSQGEIKGSARSIASFNITDAISKFSNLVLRFGGHAQAAGFSLDHDNIHQFVKEITEFANNTITAEDLIKELNIDMELEIDEIDLDLYSQISQLEPFGFKNSTPVFIIKELTINNIFFLGKDKKHIKLLLEKNNKVLTAINFHFEPKYNDLKIGDKIDVVGTLNTNKWNNQETLQIVIRDIR
jgi:single-stranded-DNA-specific exonuclease